MNRCHYIAGKWQTAAVFVLLFALSACGGKQTIPLDMQFDAPVTADEYYRMAMEYAVDRSYWRHEFEAFHLYWKAAELGHVKAQERTGWGVQFGLGTDRDVEEAEKWYRLAAEAGNADAMASLGVFLHKGYGGKKDPGQALSWTRKAAMLGSSAGLNNMGSMHRNGDGVNRDYDQAVHYYRQAAALGYPLAQSNLGTMYEKGLGVEKDIAAAYELFRESCTDTDRYGFGGCYNLLRKSKAFEANQIEAKRAAKILAEACEEFQETACRYAGFVYLREYGATRDIIKTVEYWQRGCALDDAASCRLVGELYSYDEDIEDRVLARILLHKACERGDQISCLDLEGYSKNDDG